MFLATDSELCEHFGNMSK